MVVSFNMCLVFSGWHKEVVWGVVRLSATDGTRTVP